MPFKILSGGDEKVIRLFEAPFGFAEAFNDLNSVAKNDTKLIIFIKTEFLHSRDKYFDPIRNQYESTRNQVEYNRNL